jgi:hypothetical protein
MLSPTHALVRKCSFRVYHRPGYLQAKFQPLLPPMCLPSLRCLLLFSMPANQRSPFPSTLHPGNTTICQLLWGHHCRRGSLIGPRPYGRCTGGLPRPKENARLTIPHAAHRRQPSRRGCSHWSVQALRSYLLSNCRLCSPAQCSPPWCPRHGSTCQSDILLTAHGSFISEFSCSCLGCQHGKIR